jgi:hypothetical protein
MDLFMRKKTFQMTKFCSTNIVEEISGCFFSRYYLFIYRLRNYINIELFPASLFIAYHIILNCSFLSSCYGFFFKLNEIPRNN